MSGSTYITIWEGFTTDPKHRKNLGDSGWLYRFMVYKADWQTGVIAEWKDEPVARMFGLSLDAVRRQRRRLEDLGYIKCTLKPRGQEIAITKWRDPRTYYHCGHVRLRPGLILDPKHHQRIGECLWLFEYMLWRADADGRINQWRDKEESDHLEIPLRTLREQRRKLEPYVLSKQTLRCQTLQIMKAFPQARPHVGPSDEPKTKVGLNCHHEYSRLGPKRHHGGVRVGLNCHHESHDDSHGYTHGDALGPPSTLYNHEPCTHTHAVPSSYVNPVFLNRTRAPSSAVIAYQARFGLDPPPAARQRIEREVNDLLVWQGVLNYWAENGYRDRSAGVMLDCYHERIGKLKKPKPNIKARSRAPAVRSITQVGATEQDWRRKYWTGLKENEDDPDLPADIRVACKQLREALPKLEEPQAKKIFDQINRELAAVASG